MTPKQTVVRLLTKIYPRFWRDSYGPEIEAILLSRPLTAAVAFDVLRNATLERIRRSHPCRTCGLFLFVLSSVGLTWNSIAPLSPEPYARFMGAVNLALFAAACYSTASGRDRIGGTIFETTKALFFGISPDIFVMLLWAVGLLHPTVFGSMPQPGTGPHTAVFYVRISGPPANGPLKLLAAELFSLLGSGFVIGLVGGALGRLTRVALRRATRA